MLVGAAELWVEGRLVEVVPQILTGLLPTPQLVTEQAPIPQVGQGLWDQ